MRSLVVRAFALVLGLAMGAPLFAADRKPEFARPPYAGAYEPQGTDERGLWMEMDDAERYLRDSPGVVRDEALNTYLKGVLCRTVGIDRCDATRIYVIRQRAFNASMAPNGLMIVHTGLLARVHSEAELASVLAHEFAHFELRHSLAGFRKARSSTDMLAWLALGGAVTNTNTSATQNAIVAAFYSHNRAQERDADLLSAAYIRSSPYPLQFSVIWKRLLEEHDALREERRLRKIRRASPGVVDTHPTELQRITYLAQLEAEEGAQKGDDGKAFYLEQTARVLPELFDSLVRSNEFAGVDYVIRSRGDTLGWDGLMLHTRAELYRLRDHPRDMVTARQFYEKATSLANAPPEAWRGLGLSAMRLGETATGKEALRTYLAKRPDAVDAASIRLLLE